MSNETNEVKNAATAAAKEVVPFKAKLDRIKARVKDPTHGYLSRIIDFQDVLINEGIDESVLKVLEIITKYRNGNAEITLGEANVDAITLSAHLVFISGKVGELQGRTTHYENIKNLVRSKNSLEARAYSEETKDRVTDKEAEEIGRVLSEDAYFEIASIELAQKYLSGIMFNGRFFCEVLNNVANRLIREV